MFSADRLRSLHRGLLRVEDGLLVSLLGLMVLLATGQILLRNLFDAGISCGDPTLRLLVLWLALLGAMAATRDDNHIRIDLLSRYLPGHWRRHARRLTDLFSALVCSLLAWHAGRFVLFEYQDGVVLMGWLPAWVAELILPFGFSVMALRFALPLVIAPPPEPPR